ncbi:DUF1186 domain-containing protein [Pseudobacteroides cellulosolvens]|uniref:SEC-C motif domain protein n=1 Tax=Pseudobacteroides cellulosolvens ATCC 35603 = DSM 2933 TaxID=398512 RepID=A0A0L6JMN2_9FIRM|nr:DUF1186 domain-containing protein [Pseudobacteroides cellulosolvens]KNY27029.1 protein of unknown function DUF1186 [Pseudobacteroides cellulosolvens ATCC 35603 = DSM 2933]
MVNDKNKNKMPNNVDYSKYSISDLIKFIEFNKVGFPEPVLRNLIERKEEAVPVLLDVLKKVYDNYKRYANDEDYFGHIYSIYLLAQFKVTEAYRMYVELLKLPDDLPYKLFGDSLCESTGRLLASLCGNDYEPIKTIITDNNIDDIIRSHGVAAIAILAAQGTSDRGEVLNYYKDLLVSDSWDKNEAVMAEVVSACNDLYPAEVIDEIRAAYEKEFVDESVIELESVEKNLKKSKDEVIEATKSDRYYNFIEDTIEEIKDWSCFDEDGNEAGDKAANSGKVGPNQLCPCGSGKKYKKCCG